MTSLARLAVDTGGRYTERTNDLTLGYAKARQDLECVYSVGFYVDDTETDRVGNVTIRARPDGLRAIHPSKYIFRSNSAKRQSKLRAAWASPEMFQTGVVRAHVYPLRPTSTDKWDGLLAVSFPVPLGETKGKPVHREFGAVLYRGSRIAHRFNRQITLEPTSADVTSAPTVTFLEPVRLSPGQFTMTAVLSESASGEAHAAKVNVSVPAIPKRELFLIGPVLGRPSGPNLVVTGGDSIEGDTIGKESTFEPLLVHQLDEPVDLVAFSQACLVGKKGLGKRKAPTITRTLLDSDGKSIGSLPDVKLELEREDADKGKVGCQNLVDVIPTSTMPDGQYVFEARLAARQEGAEAVSPEQVRFSVGFRGTVP